MKLRLCKVLSCSEHGASAVWIVHGHPWIVIGKWKLPGESSGWKIVVHDVGADPRTVDPFFQPPYDCAKLKNQLQDQTFSSRQEALQALRVSLLILEA